MTIRRLFSKPSILMIEDLLYRSKAELGIDQFRFPYLSARPVHMGKYCLDKKDFLGQGSFWRLIIHLNIGL